MSLQTFKNRLHRENTDFIVLGTLPAAQTHIQFLGQFDHKEVIWDATVTTLNKAALDRGITSLRPFIHVHSSDSDLQPVVIGLPVKIVDRPVLLKCITMLRQYKNLRLGIHEFGSNYQFP